MGQIEERLGAIARLIQTDQDANALRLHVMQLLEGPAFSGSRRSGQFLQYIMDKAVAQQTDAFKERVIGMEVFQRSPGYDTGEDAIVRVTASDVRRRLAQHYSLHGRSSEFRITLPPGSYAPEIYRDLPEPLTAAVDPVHSTSVTNPRLIGTEESFQLSAARSLEKPQASPRSAGSWNLILLVSLASAVILVGMAGFLIGRRGTASSPAPAPAPAPWSLLFTPDKPLLVVMADPDLNEIQSLTGHYVSAADYAAGKLGCDTLAAPLQPLCIHNLRGDKSSTVDVAAIARVATLAGHYGSTVQSLEARSLRLPDLQTDRNVVLFGSRVSNPWVDLYRDKVDFYVGHDDKAGLQVIYNLHRRTGEADTYVPTAGPFGSGDTYTLITFLRNLNGKGHALLLSGATHEGMDAATNFVLDPDQVARTRTACGIRADDTPFQILLKLKMMAGSPLTVTSLICHRLSA